MSNIISCPDCEGKVSLNAKSCPHCGNTKIDPKKVAAQERQKQLDIMTSILGIPKCPACGGVATSLKGQRGAAFGAGNLIGAFSNSMRCGACGHLF